MGRGRRYNNDEPKLNIKKVVAVIITILVIIMFGYTGGVQAFIYANF